MGESTDSNYSFSSTGSPILENLCSHKERPCNRLCLVDSPFCAIHTIGHPELSYVQCSSVIDSFQCKKVVHKASRTRYCPYHEKIKAKATTLRTSDSSTFGRSDPRVIPRPDEPRTLVEGLYKLKDNEAAYDNFSSDGESVDSEGSDDPMKHAGIFSTEELLNEAINRWKKYLSLCLESLGELRYEMIESHRQSLSNEVDTRMTTDNDNSVTVNSPRLAAELKAYKKFLKIPKKETVHANNSMMQKFLVNYKQTKPNSSCQFPIPKSGNGKDRCYELVIPCTTYCLKHLTMKTDLKNKSNLDRLPNQVLFKKCNGGPNNDCGEIVVKWNPDSRCRIHTGLEDALYDPVISDRNKQLLHNFEFDTSTISSFVNK